MLINIQRHLLLKSTLKIVYLFFRRLKFVFSIQIFTFIFLTNVFFSYSCNEVFFILTHPKN